ncbi:WD repeat-containing protein DWA2, partial [Cucurbita argyrosperma subsp. argyrosperma]
MNLFPIVNQLTIPTICVLFPNKNLLDSVLWWPSGRHDKLISIDEENILLWSLDCSRKLAQVDLTRFLMGPTRYILELLSAQGRSL